MTEFKATEFQGLKLRANLKINATAVTYLLTKFIDQVYKVYTY